jgi:hypothetical protein
MFRIHKIFDVTTPTNRHLLSQVQAMLGVQPGMPAHAPLAPASVSLAGETAAIADALA